ncbi:MAG: alpha-amylase family glycosyl hydrolase [Ignavibacteriaceae bacterium]|nr:alpha-amylase family glycosyl hydrolase [Ignavibacteriaceae bacterium]
MNKLFNKILLSTLLIGLISLKISGQQFSPPDWSYNKAIYEVNVRQYSKEGTFKAFEKHLPKLKQLGADILWFMPINPIGIKNRKGTLGSYYSVKNYTEVNPEFGTLEDFKSMVKLFHKMGMYVIIDWVANHTAWDNPWIKEHPDFYNKDSVGNTISPNPDWTDVADLNYDNKELWKEMIKSLNFWVEECDIDGYRCDVAGMVPIEFWIEARTELEKTKKLFMLAEWDTPAMHLAFDMTYDWGLYKTLNGIAKGEKNVKNLVNHIKRDQQEYPLNAFRMQFTSNHDENSWNGTVFERLGDGAEACAVLTCLVPDMPLVYTGQEAGNAKRLSFFERDPVEWKDYELFNIYSKLFQLKKDNKALLNGEQGGEIIFLKSSDEENIFAFTRVSGKDKVLAVFNLSKNPIEFDLMGENLEGSYRNLFTGKLESFAIRETFKLKAWEYRVYTK